MALRRRKTVKSSFDVAREHQEAALGIFDEILFGLDVADDNYAEHQANNDQLIEHLKAEVTRLQDEQNTVATELERNARVRSKVQEIRG